MFAYGQRWPGTQPPELNAFRNWVERYRTAVPSDRTVMVAEGVALARARRMAMLALIQNEPRLALSLTVPASLRETLPATILAELETRVAGIGDYALIPIEADARDKGGYTGNGVERLVYLDGRSYQAHVYGRRSKQQTQENASLHGIALDGHLALHESPLRVLEPGERAEQAIEPRDPITGETVASIRAADFALVRAQGRTWMLAPRENVMVLADEMNAAEDLPGPKVPILLEADGSGHPLIAAATATPWTTGIKKVLVIRVDFPDLPGAPVNSTTGLPFTTEHWKSLCDSVIAPFYEENSYGSATVDCSITGSVYRMPTTALTYAKSADIALMHADAVAVSGVDPSSHDVIAIAHSYIGPNWNEASGFNWAGIAYVGGSKLFLNGHFDLRVFAHELGHTYGLLHANLWQVSDGDPVSANGTKLEYGDVFDVMGSGRDATHHFNEAHKNLLGWLPDSRVHDVTASGTHRLHRFDVKNPVPGQPLALRIDRDGVLSYWIGYRRPAPYLQTPQDGLYALWTEKGQNDTRSLDLSPGSNSFDVSLPVGSTLDDSSWRISINTLATGGSGSNAYVDVQVTLEPREKAGTVSVWGIGSALNVPNALNDVRSFASGAVHMLALRGDGTVVTWGGDPSILAVPDGLSDVTGVAAGSTVNAAILQGGDLVLWGSPDSGLLNAPATAVDIRQVSIGHRHALALRNDGVVVGWGDNEFDKSTNPAAVRDAIAVETGDDASFVLQADGTVVGWGPDYSAVPSALTDVVAISAGSAHTLALKRDGTVVAWGAPFIDGWVIPQNLKNVRGVVAGGAHSLALLEDGSIVAWGAPESPHNTVPGDLPTASAIAGGLVHSAALAGTGAPAITVQPWSRTIAAGSAAKFTTFAVGDGGLGYGWQRQPAGETTWDNLQNGGTYSGVSTPTLQVSAAPAALSGEKFRCVVTGPVAPAVTSDAVTLLIEGAWIGVAAHSADKTAFVHQTAVFAVAPYGVAPFSYRWSKDGVAIPGANAAQLVLDDVSIDDAGGYSVMVSNAYGSVVSPPATLTVEKWPQSIDFPAIGSHTFGDAPFGLNGLASSGLPVSYTVTGPAIVSGDTLAPIGAGTVAVTAWQSGNSDYAPAAEVVRVFAVGKALASVSLNALSATYDGLAKTVAVITVPEGLASSIIYNGSATAPVNAGSYAVVATIDVPDYSGIATGTLVIAKARPVISWPAPAAIVYGTPLSELQLNATASVPGSFSYTPAPNQKPSAGADQVLETVFTPLDADNYATATATTHIAVERVPLTVRAANKSRVYGAPNPELTVSHSGFVNGETMDVLTTLPVVATPASESSAVGTYPITASGGFAANYAISYIPGALTVTEATAAISISDTVQTYDGTPRPVSVATIPAGLSVRTTYEGKMTAPQDPGAYTVLVFIEDANYAGTATATLQINPADYSGDYFGSTGNGGSWAMYVRSGNRGKFIGHLPDGPSGLVFDVSVEADGSFTCSGSPFTRNQAQARAFVNGAVTLRGRIVDGVVTGQIMELELSIDGQMDVLQGPAGSMAGFYEAFAINGASGSTYAVIGASGTAMVLVVSSEVVDGGKATVSDDGHLTASLFGASLVSLTVDPTGGGIAGTVTPGGQGASLSVSGLSAAYAPVNRIVNLSTRGYVGTGEDAMIAGFVISGTGTRPVLVRAIGPSLREIVAGAISDPVLVVKRLDDGGEVAANDNWGTNPNLPAILDAIDHTGAFPVLQSSLDAMLLLELSVGSYTASTSGNYATGIAIAEVYSVDESTLSTARLSNISTRAVASSGDGIMIPGFVTSGNAPRRLLIRAVGPALGQFGVAGAMTDPTLRIFTSDRFEVASNDDWDIAG
ncbi:MAG TPA: MBG domain-containing protein, partial [Opitutaceae bacterium]